MPAELLIIGTAGLAKEAAHLARQIDPGKNRWDRISYVAESAASLGRVLPYGEVRYTDAQLDEIDRNVDVAIGIGNPAVRRLVAERLLANPNFRFPNLVHPGLDFTPDVVSLGYGNMICKGVALTCNIEIGNFNLLNLNVTVGHDARIDSFCVVNPGTNLSGNVHLSDACLLGTGSQVLEGLDLTESTVVGAGAVVVASIKVSGIYVGIPARLLK